jgi:hypothetical protein
MNAALSASLMKNVRNWKNSEAEADHSDRLSASGVMWCGPGAARRPAAV